MKPLRTIFGLGIAASAALVLAACGGGSTTTGTTTTAASPAASPAAGGSMKSAAHPMMGKGHAMKGGSMSIPMAAQNGSKQTGTVMITGSGTGVSVSVSVTNEPKGASEPAHIHTGTCSNLGGVYKPLSNVDGGKSATTVAGVTVAQLKGGKDAVNVHKSASDLKTYVSCGNL